jgi:hypothetical protein
MSGCLWSKKEENLLREATREPIPTNTKAEALLIVQKCVPHRSIDAIKRKMITMGIAFKIRGPEVQRQYLNELTLLRRPV